MSATDRSFLPKLHLARTQINGETMQTNGTQQPADFRLSCEEFAALNQVKAQSVRARLCRTGSYFGVTPKKLVNGRLAFPAVQVAQ